MPSSSSYSWSSSSSSSEAPLQWPTLAKGMEFEIAETVDDGGVLATQPDEGRTIVSVQYYRAVHRLRISYRLLSMADRVTLERFHLLTAVGGVKCFEVTHPKSGETWRCRFDPAGGPAWRLNPDNPNKHDCDIELIEDIADGYAVGIYDV